MQRSPFHALLEWTRPRSAAALFLLADFLEKRVHNSRAVSAKFYNVG